ISSGIDTADYETATVLDSLGDLLTDYWILVVLFVICLLLFIILAYVCHYIALGGIYHGASLAKQGKPVHFWALCQAGTQTFWRVLGVTLLFSISLGLAVTSIVLCLIFLAFTIIGLILVIPGIFLLILITIPASWFVAALFSFTIQGIVIERLTIWDSITAAYRLFKKNWVHTLVAYASVVGWNVAAVIVTLLILVLIAMPVAIFGMVAYTSQAWLAFGLAMLAALSLFGVLALFIKGISQSFAAHAWHGFYIACRDSSAVEQ
ncbi:MAG: hypothetical protein ACD_41C00108G0001, partial [uncultured bacterium]